MSPKTSFFSKRGVRSILRMRELISAMLPPGLAGSAETSSEASTILCLFSLSLPHVSGLPPSDGVVGTRSASPPNSESVAAVDAELNDEDGVSGGVRRAGRRWGELLVYRAAPEKVLFRGEF